MTEQIVKSRLTDFFSANNLVNNFQSVYCSLNIILPNLLCLLSKAIEAMGQKKVTALCLLDLSIVCDTIDHSKLLHHLCLALLIVALFLGLNLTIPLDFSRLMLVITSMLMTLNNFFLLLASIQESATSKLLHLKPPPIDGLQSSVT